MTNSKVTVRVDCAVSACSPLPLSMKALAHWLSLAAFGQESTPLLRPTPVAGIQNEAKVPFHQPGFFNDFWAVNS